MLPAISRIPHLRLRLLALGVQAIALAIGVWHHEPWADEAQAWLLARDSSVVDLVVHNVRYEGSPPLWHLLLAIPAKAGLPYWSINVISAACAWTGAFLFVLSPAVPTAFCVALPFTFFFVFQYAVVGRSYALLLPLLGLLVHAHRRFIERPGGYYSAAILLSWSSVHGGILAVSLLAERLWRLLRAWKSFSGPTRLRHLAWLGLTGVSFALMAAVIWTPPDYVPLAAQPQTMDAIAGRVLGVVLRGFSDNSTAIFAVALSVLWFARYSAWLPFALGCLLLALLAAAKYVAPWHSGITFLLWVCCIWLGFRNRENCERTVLTWVGDGLLFSFLLLHVYYGASAQIHDFGKPYSGSRAAAEYLKRSLSPGDRVFGCGYSATALQPYFPRNLYANYHDGGPPAFWLWSARNDMPKHFMRGLERRPEFVVLSTRPAPPPMGLMRALAQLGRFQSEGYTIAGVFRGQIPWYGSVLEDESYIVLKRIR